MIQLRIRAPGNARSFRLAANVLAADYPEWICSPFNDVFVVLLDSLFVLFSFFLAHHKKSL